MAVKERKSRRMHASARLLSTDLPGLPKSDDFGIIGSTLNAEPVRQRVAAPLFILGAGFGRDARAVVGSNFQVDVRYPLLADLPNICFPDGLVAAQEVERRLASDISSNDFQPLERLARHLDKTDWHLARRIFDDRSSPYAAFLADFPDSAFLTFNYDSLIETGLLNCGRWYPWDGYGVPVSVGPGSGVEESAMSESVVLHLHGSLRVYTFNFTAQPDASGMEMLESTPPRFVFDPGSLGELFYPHTRGVVPFFPGVPGRIVAPVPDKAVGLKLAFVRAVRERALALLEENRIMVSVGYSFADGDRASYSELLEAPCRTGRRRVVVVAPDAKQLVNTLKPAYPRLDWEPQALGFSDWVAEGYTGVT